MGTRTEYSKTNRHQNPRILVVTPEVSFVRHGVGPASWSISTKAGGLGDICTAQVQALYEHGLDVHLAMARQNRIPWLFTLFRLDSPRLLLSTIEEQGIDAASFWQHCFYARMPVDYQETRNTNPLDLLTSGVFAAGWATTLSQSFQNGLTDECNHFAAPALKAELQNKLRAGRLCAVAPAPDPSFNPAVDRMLLQSYGPGTHDVGKPFNKLQLQETLNLRLDATAPLCFWPTRLDGSRSGCRLMADTLAAILDRTGAQRLQVVFIADGDFQDHLHGLIGRLLASDRAAVCGFDARRYRLAHSGADFVLMPMHRDPCALPGKIGQRYGALPIGHDAGAIHDCVEHLEPAGNRGTGFLFKHFDANGLLWAVDQAMAFYNRPRAFRSAQVRRIMADSLSRFDPGDTARHTIGLYARALGRSLVHLRTEPGLAAPSQIAA